MIRAYAQLLEELSGAAGNVHDETILPFPKWQVANALVSAMHSEIKPEIRSAMAISLVSLADFQPRVGQTLCSPASRIAEIAKTRLGQSAEELAKAISSSTDPVRDRRYEAVQRFVQMETGFFTAIVNSIEGRRSASA